MIEQPSKPSNQMELNLPGFTQDGEILMAEARMWAGRNYDAFAWYKDFARKRCIGGQKASPNLCLQAMRDQFHISVPNSYAPALARIAMEQDSRLSFRLARSKVDGFTKARLS
jgi:hypothetical protein